MKYSVEEYRRVDEAFMKRTDCLCEDTPPDQCDCSQCPAQMQCRWLCKYDPYNK